MMIRIPALALILFTVLSCSTPGQTILEAEITAPAGSSIDFESADPAQAEDRPQNFTEEDILLYLPLPANIGAVNGENGSMKAIILSPALPVKTSVNIIPIALLTFPDRSSSYDKLIAIPADESLQVIKSPTLDQLESNYPGVTDILKIWFNNYRGNGIEGGVEIKNGEQAEVRLQEIL